eukprot:194277_1
MSVILVTFHWYLLWSMRIKVTFGAKSCTPSTDCSTPTSTSFSCNSNTCTIVCSASSCEFHTITCNTGTICDITCTGANSCASSTIYALDANDLTIRSGGATGNNQLGSTDITCPNNGPGGAPSCHIHGEGGASLQFWRANIFAVEGFNDVEISCSTSNCMTEAQMACRSDYQAKCIVNDNSPPTINTCESTLTPSYPTSYCENYQLIPITAVPSTSIPTTSIPTTQSPTTFAPSSMSPSTSQPTTYIPTTNMPTTDMPTTNVPTNIPTTILPTSSAPSSSLSSSTQQTTFENDGAIRTMFKTTNALTKAEDTTKNNDM